MRRLHDMVGAFFEEIGGLATLIIIMAVVLVAAAFLIGCGGIESGTVERKTHEPEETTFMMMPVQTGSVCSGGNPPVCTPIYGMFPFWIHDDEDWRLHLRDGDKTGDVTVSEQVWNDTAIGSDFGEKPEKDENASVMSKERPSDF